MASKAVGNVFQVLCPTRNYGVGARVTRKCWSKFAEPTYWEITRVHPSQDLKHGKAFGHFTFRGASRSCCPSLSLLSCGLRKCACDYCQSIFVIWVLMSSC